MHFQACCLPFCFFPFPTSLTRWMANIKSVLINIKGWWKTLLFILASLKSHLKPVYCLIFFFYFKRIFDQDACVLSMCGLFREREENGRKKSGVLCL